MEKKTKQKKSHEETATSSTLMTLVDFQFNLTDEKKKKNWLLCK